MYVLLNIFDVWFAFFMQCDIDWARKMIDQFAVQLKDVRRADLPQIGSRVCFISCDDSWTPSAVDPPGFLSSLFSRGTTSGWETGLEKCLTLKGYAVGRLTRHRRTIAALLGVGTLILFSLSVLLARR